MINEDFFRWRYFENDNWVQIWVTVCNQEDLICIYKYAKQNMRNKNWYFFYKRGLVHIKILVCKKYIKEITNFCNKINFIDKNCSIHNFEPEYYQFGGRESWEYCVKWFNLCTQLSFTNNNSLFDTAYSVVSGIMDQLYGDEKALTIKNLRFLRNVSDNVNIECHNHFSIIYIPI